MRARSTISGWVLVAMFVAACSLSETDVVAPPTSSTAAAHSVAETSTSTSPSEPEAEDEEKPVATTGDTADLVPSRPAAEGNDTPDDNPTWLGRSSMTSASIELPWSIGPNEGHVEIHRFDAADVENVDDVTLTEASLVSSGEASPFIDTDLSPGAQHLYVLQATIDGVTYRRFTEAHAVDDTTPPAPVVDLRLEVVGDAIHLEWGASSDDYRFARYAIRRSLDGEPSIYYGTGWTIGQTSFIDDQPPDSGSIIYEVFAVDFHDNVSEVRTVSTNR